MFIKCKKCGVIHEKSIFIENHYICKACGYHETLNYAQRIQLVIDHGTFKEMNSEFGFQNPINFPGYQEKYENAVNNTGLKEAVVTGEGNIMGIKIMIGVMDSRFMMSSMGSVVGEKITLLFEEGYHQKKPVILFIASGGARMQEGIISLMQMAKTSAAVAKFRENGGLYLSILTNPTTGGVSASFAFLGDLILAEPDALIGFAGRRVIQQTIKQELPDNFQTSEYLLEHGFIDSIVERKNLKETLNYLLKLHSY